MWRTLQISKSCIKEKTSKVSEFNGEKKKRTRKRKKCTENEQKNKQLCRQL